MPNLTTPRGEGNRAPPGHGLISDWARTVLLATRGVLPHEWLSKFVHSRWGVSRFTFTEFYVVGSTITIAAVSLAIPTDANLILIWFGVAVAMALIAESYVANLVIVLVDALLPHWDSRLDLRRNFILLGLNFFELVLAFSIVFRLIERLSTGDSFGTGLTSRLEAVSYSVSVATTTSFASFGPKDRAASMAAATEAVLAILLLVLVVNVFLAARTVPRQR